MEKAPKKKCKMGNYASEIQNYIISADKMHLSCENIFFEL
jgi:hypothetical protein